MTLSRFKINFIPAVIAVVLFGVHSISAEESLGDFLTHHISNSDTWRPVPFLPMIQLPTGWKVFGIDLSISQHVLMMLIASVLLILAFAFGSRRKLSAPVSRLGHALEALILYIRDEVVVPNLGKKETPKWLPFFLTIFFFFLVLNLISLIPGFSAATGNINFTAAMALMIFLVYNLAGMFYNGPGHYVINIFPKGLPWPIMLIIVPIELVGLITKAFALCIRLFANMTAGHILLLSLTGLIIVFKTAWVGLGFLPLTLFIYLIEILVAFLQAYIFTLLSALFVGMAIHQDH